MKARRPRGYIDHEYDLDFGDDLLTKQEAADKMRCSVRTVERMFKDGLPKTKIGRLTRINPYALNKYLRKKTVMAKA